MNPLPLLVALLTMAALAGAPLSGDLTVWPNTTSFANSDPWLAANHDRLREMRPRFLVLNFSNRASMEKVRQMTADLIAAIAEASRYHGYKNSNAPAFLKYEVFKFVDARDGSSGENAAGIPLKAGVTNEFNVRYSGFFEDDFARKIGVRDPKDASRFLRLDELVDLGWVHEVIFFAEGSEAVKAYEVVELKPQYDEQFRQVPNKYAQAGNGGDLDQKWTGRSVRIGFVNASRGIGCYLESLSHGIEGTAKSKAIPYFSRQFLPFAGYDLIQRFDIPLDTFYRLPYGQEVIRYPDERRAEITYRGKTHILTNYVASGGNAHFPPNSRQHYDLQNTNAVLSTIEDWRIGSDNGRDRAEPWTNARFQRFNSLAPDCMGPWLVYWRQNFPGLDNEQRDENGRPMKNWWPFLFY